MENGKVYNPKTGRYVSASGALGKKLLKAQAEENKKSLKRVESVDLDVLKTVAKSSQGRRTSKKEAQQIKDAIKKIEDIPVDILIKVLEMMGYKAE